MAQVDPKVKQLIDSLQKTLRTVGNASKEQVTINGQLLKVITLLESGFSRNEEDAKNLIAKVKKGQQITDEVASEWAKSRKATKSDLDEIFLKFRKIEKIHLKITDTAEDLRDNIDDVNDSLDLQIDLSSKLFDSYDAVNVAIRESRKAVEKFGVGATEANVAISKVIDSAISRQGLISSMFNDMFSSMEGASELIGKMQQDASSMINNLSGMSVDVSLNYDAASGQLDSEISRVSDLIDIEKTARLAGLVEFFNKNEELQTKMARKMAASMSNVGFEYDIDTGNVKKAGRILEQGSEQYLSAIQQLDSLSIDMDSLSGVRDLYLDIFELMSMGNARTQDQNALLDNLNSKLDLGTQAIVRAHIERQKELDVLRDTIQLEKNRLKVMRGYGPSMQMAENAVIRMGRGFDYINSILPAGIGDILGLQKVSLNLIDAHRDGVKSFFDELGKGSTKAEALSKYFKSYGPSLRGILTPTTAIIAGLALMYNYVSNISDKYKDLSQNMGISLGQAQKMLDVQLDILTSTKNQFSTLEDIQAIQTAMIGSSGRISSVIDQNNKNLILGLSEVGKVFGYGAEQAVHLHKIFEGLGANNQLALNLQESLGFAAELAGLSPQIIAKDLVESSEEVYTYFAGIPEEAARAAIQVRRLGMSLKQAGSIAQKMLKMESFMTDMYELQAMTGPGGIDFSRAFDKGLMGDIEGMTKEIMNEIDSTAELNKMDYMTRMKIANTLGMSVEELSKSVLLREKMAELAPAEAAALENNLDRMGDISNLSKDQIKDRLKQLQSTDRLKIAWDKISGTFTRALLPLVESFADAMDAVNPIIEIVIGSIKLIGISLRPLFPIIKGFIAPFKFVGEILTSIISKIDDIGSSLGFLDPIFKKIGDFTYWIGAGIGTWFMITSAPKLFVSMISTLGSLLKIIPGVSSLMGIFGKKSTESAKSTESSMVEMASDVRTTMVGMAETVKTAMGDMVREVRNSINTLRTEAKTPITITTTTKKTIDSVGTDIGGTTSTTVKKKKKAPTELAPVEIQAPEIVSESNSKKSVSRSKATFKAIGSIGAATFASLAVNLAGSLIRGGEEGQEGLMSMAESSLPMMGSVLAMAGPMIFDSISQGFEKFFRKSLEGKFEEKLEPVLKKVRKTVEKIPGVGGSNVEIPEKPETKPKVKDLDTEIKPEKKKIKEPDIDKELQKSKKTTSKSLSDVSESTSSIWDKISSTITGIVDTGIEIVKKIAKGIVDVGKMLSKGIEDIFGSVLNMLKSSSKTIKVVLNDLSSSVGSIMKNLGSGIGEAIKGILKGIGDGLSSFKTSAIKGAAALVILSGALWITSKAMENFANVSWSDVSKGMVSIGGLAAIAVVLGNVSGNILLGAAAIGVLGAALIPAAYAFGMFNSVDWSALGKAGVAIIGLATVAGILGTIMMSGVGAAALALGAIAIAGLGAALIPAAYAMNIFAKSAPIFTDSIVKIVDAIGGLVTNIGMAISNIITSAGAAISDVVESISSLGDIDVSKMLLVSAGLISFSVSLMAFGTSIALSAIPIIAGVAVLNMLSIAIDNISSAISKLTIPDIDLSGLFKIAELPILRILAVGSSLVAFSGLMSAFAIGMIAASPLILAASGILSIAAVGIQLFANSITLFQSAIGKIDVSPFTKISSLSEINFFEIAKGIISIGSAFGYLSAASSMGSVVDQFFGNSKIKMLKELAGLATPLESVAFSIQSISSALSQLSEILSNLKDSDFKSLDAISKLDVDKTKPVNAELESYASFEQPTHDISEGYVPIRAASSIPMAPLKRNMAQDVRIRETNQNNLEEETLSNSNRDYDSPTTQVDMKGVERLLRELINAFHNYAQRPNEVSIGKEGMNLIYSGLKPFYNNR